MTTPTSSWVPTAEVTIDCDDNDTTEDVPLATAVRVAAQAILEDGSDRDMEVGDVAVTAEEDSSMRAITYQQLMELEEKTRRVLGKRAFQRATMRTVICTIIEPSCRKTGMCYARQLNPEGLTTDAFITHAWDEPFGAFVEVRGYTSQIYSDCTTAGTLVSHFLRTVDSPGLSCDLEQTQPLDLRHCYFSRRHRGNC